MTGTRNAGEGWESEGRGALSALQFYLDLPQSVVIISHSEDQLEQALSLTHHSCSRVLIGSHIRFHCLLDDNVYFSCWDAELC